MFPGNLEEIGQKFVPRKFYRIEGDTVRVIRILNEKQDFFQILFGISSISEEGRDYWGD